MPYALVSVNQTLYDQKIANVFAFSNVQEDSAWLIGFADAIRALYNDLVDGKMVTRWTLDNLTVAFISGSGISYSVDVGFTAGNLQGNVLGNGMPGGSALLVSTGFTGPKPNRGRTFFSGLGEDQQQDGEWDSGARTAYRSLIQALRDGITVNESTANLVICRRPSAVFSTYAFNPVQIVTTSQYTRSQRRRNIGL